MSQPGFLVHISNLHTSYTTIKQGDDTMPWELCDRAVEDSMPAWSVHQAMEWVCLNVMEPYIDKTKEICNLFWKETINHNGWNAN